MKKVIFFLFITIFLVGCTGDNSGDSDNIETGLPFSYTESDEFILRLFADNDVYQAGDVITVWAEFEYAGDEESITIYHSEPYLVFQIVGDHDFEMLPIRIDVLESSTLRSGEVYHFDFQKSGGWSQDDEDADFWEAFFDDPHLILPPGTYTITVIAEFSLSGDDVIGTQMTILTNISIVVE